MYKLKDCSEGDEWSIFKVRLMARGFTQEKCVNYNKVFSPVAKYATGEKTLLKRVLFV